MRRFYLRGRVAFMAFFLLRRPDTRMRALRTSWGLMRLSVSVVTNADPLIGPTQTHVDVHALSEPADLVVPGAGFILLAAYVRRKTN